MAIKETLAYDITLNSEAATSSVGSFKKQLREANAELLNMANQFGEASTEAINAAQKVAKLKDSIGDAKALADTFNPDKKFVALGGALQGATAGFSALQGAMGLFGSEGKEVEKMMLKVQSAMALQQGISGIFEARDALGLLKDGAVRTFQSIKAAIGATGIGLFVVALGAIYAYWDDIKEAVSGVSEEQKKLTKASQENLKAEKEKLSDIGSQDNILKLQGKSEREILMLKKAQIQSVIEATKAVIVQDKITTKAQVSAAERNFNLLKGLLDFLILPQRMLFEYGSNAINKLIGLLNKIPGINIDFKINEKMADDATDYLAKLIFDPKKIAADAELVEKENQKAILKLQNDAAGSQLAINAIDKKAAEEAFVDKMKGMERTRIETELIQGKAAESTVQINSNAANAVLNATKQTEEQKALLLQKYKDIDLAFDEARFQSKMQFVDAIGGALGTLGALFEKDTAAAKALALAEIAIGVAKGYINGLGIAQKSAAAAGPGAAFAFPIFYAGQIAAVLAAAGKAKGILSSVKGGGGGGSVSMSAPSIASASAPITPQAQTTTLSTQSINQIGVASSRAFVLETDVTNNQERIQRLNRAARIN